MNSPRLADVDEIPPDLTLEDLDHDTLFRLVEASANGIVFVDAWRLVYANPAALETLGRDPGAVEGWDLREAFDVPGRRLLASASDGTTYGARVVRPDGDHREIAFWTIPVEVEGDRLRALVFDDATASARLDRATEALVNIASSLAFDQPLETTLNSIAARALESTRAVACGVVLIEANPLRIHSAGAAGDIVDFMDTSPLRIRSVGSAGDVDMDWSASEEAWIKGTSSATPTAYRERRTVVETYLRQRLLADPVFAPVHDELRRSSWDSVVAHPLFDDGAPIGVFTSFYAGPAPDAGEIELLEAIARHAATAVRSAKLFGEATANAAQEERQQLAHELHDSVSQVLYGIVLGTRTAQAQIPAQPARAAEAIDYVLTLADAGLAEMRALLFELRPDSLEQEGLCSALAKQAAAVRARHGIVVEERLDVEPDVPFETKETLYRIAQEAVRDVIRAGNARRIEIVLREEPRAVVLEVLDDGTASGGSRTLTSHRIIVERAARIGGKLESSGVADGASWLRVSVPRAAAGVPS